MEIQRGNNRIPDAEIKLRTNKERNETSEIHSIFFVILCGIWDVKKNHIERLCF